MDGDILEVVFGGINDGEFFAVAFAAFFGYSEFVFAGQIFTSNGIWVFHYFGGCTSGDDASAMLSGSWTNIEDVIRSEHGIDIVFDDDDGVADVAEVDQCFDQLVVVVLMEADRRFVENINDAGEA